jgi:Ca-activated chloride channel family protein
MKKIIALLYLFVGFSISGCIEKTTEQSTQNNPNILTVRAGSELKDIEPLLPLIEKATGISLKMQYSGTIDAVEKLQAGEEVDVAWLASNHYAMLIPAVKTRIAASERTMMTPVVLGIKESKAKELGWVNNPNVSWKDIANAAIQQKFTFGMTSPSSSNTGFSGLLGLSAALSGKGDALEEKDIDTKRLSAFFKAQRLTAGSSGWLADAYIKEQDKVDGIINYASSLILLNQGTNLKEKLVLIYPKDGIITADYPIMLINPAKQEAYKKVMGYIRGIEFQKAMAASTFRRPINPDVQVADNAPATLIELAFPAKLAVVDAILTAFDNNLRLPTDSTFVLDKSGSMSGDRIDDLKKSMTGLSGSDTSISGRFSRFRNREQIYLLPFSNDFGEVEKFDMGNDAKTNQSALSALSEKIKAIEAEGGTAIFSATQKAYQSAMERRHADPSRFYSIVVMTDGENNNGISISNFENWYQSLPEADKGIKIFPILFGEANVGELKQLADLSGGKTFDSRKSGLQSIFKEIRGYQ